MITADTMITEQLSGETFLEACRLSPSLCTSFVMGVKQAPIHKRLQAHWTEHDDCYAEEPRGHGKTHQMIGRCAWEIGHDQNIRIKYVMQTQPEAEKTALELRTVIESARYHMVFPWVEPNLNQWGKGAFSVKRTKMMRDHTLESGGIFGRAGGRYDLLVADDICDLKNSVQSATEREKVKDSWATNWLPMGDQAAERAPRTWKVGTPYHVNDITADWRAIHGEEGSLLRDPVVDMKSPWAEVWTPEALAERRKRMGPLAYARAYELRPVSDDLLIFKPDWLHDSFWMQDGSRERRISPYDRSNGEYCATFDFAFTEQRLNNDPDWSVCLIAWVSYSGHVYVEDIVRQRTTFPEFCHDALKRCDAYQVAYGRGEGNGPQRGLVQQMDREASFPIVPIDRVTDKITRAAKRQAFVMQGRLHLLASDSDYGPPAVVPKLQPLYDEMTTFPATEHDDCVDTAIDMTDIALQRGQRHKPSKIGTGPPKAKSRDNLRRRMYR